MTRILYFTLAALYCWIPSVQAEDSVFYNKLAAMHRSAYALDYILEPPNFIKLCYQVHPSGLSPLLPDNRAQLIQALSRITRPIQKQIKANEKVATLELISDHYLDIKDNQNIDYKRFFEVYSSKAEKSRALIEQDIKAKEAVIIQFLKLGKIPGQEYCQNKLQDGRIEGLDAYWPNDANALRGEIDSMVSGAALPEIYKESYRRLLQ